MPRVLVAVLAVALALASIAAPTARADVDGDVFTSETHGVRAEVPRGWRVSEPNGYPNVLLWLSRSRPHVKIVVAYDRIVPDCRAALDVAFCNRDVAQVAAALRTQIAAAGFTITAQEQSRTPGLEYQANGRYLRHALVVVGDLVVSVILVADSAADRAAQSRLFERLTQSVRPLARAP
ncbi:MAG TPA: hypothetical protein VM734_01430 [Kofleriaceae bacterium]|nr:hypothetical protein [Kofleriaceae bacterium]